MNDQKQKNNGKNPTEQKPTKVCFVESVISGPIHRIKSHNVVRAIKDAGTQEEETVNEIRKLYAETLAATGSEKEAAKAVASLKKSLPAIMWSVSKASGRGDKNVIEYSHSLCADL